MVQTPYFGPSLTAKTINPNAPTPNAPKAFRIPPMLNWGDMPKTSVLVGPDAMEEVRAEWQELANCAPSATPFQTWEWQSTWFRHFRRSKRRAHIVTIREGKDLVGLMPLTRTIGPSGGPSGNGLGDERLPPSPCESRAMKSRSHSK